MWEYRRGLLRERRRKERRAQWGWRKRRVLHPHQYSVLTGALLWCWTTSLTTTPPGAALSLMACSCTSDVNVDFLVYTADATGWARVSSHSWCYPHMNSHREFQPAIPSSGVNRNNAVKLFDLSSNWNNITGGFVLSFFHSAIFPTQFLGLYQSSSALITVQNNLSLSYKDFGAAP